MSKFDNPVGANGPKVEAIKLSQISDVYNKNENSVVICHQNYKKYIQKKLPDLNVISVDESKGLEFYKVFVYPYYMTDNERYISFSRALYVLYIIEN